MSVSFTLDGQSATAEDGETIWQVAKRLGTDGVEVILTGYASLSMFEVDLMAEENMPYIAAGPSPAFAGIVSQDPEYYNCCWSYTASFEGYETDLLPMVDAGVRSYRAARPCRVEARPSARRAGFMTASSGRKIPYPSSPEYSSTAISFSRKHCASAAQSCASATSGSAPGNPASLIDPVRLMTSEPRTRCSESISSKVAR